MPALLFLSVLLIKKDHLEIQSLNFWIGVGPI